MKKLDRLGWAAGIPAVAYGVRVGVRVNDSSAMQDVIACLPPGWKLAASPVVDHMYSVILGHMKQGIRARPFHLLYSGIARAERTTNSEQLFDTLESVLRADVATSSARRVFVHAGVVGWRGKAVLIPGPTKAGKSRLVEALVRAGAEYYSDEFAVLDQTGTVHPFSKLLSLRRDDGAIVPDRFHAESIGGAVGTKPLRVGLIAAMQYYPGSRWRARPLSPGGAVLELLANTVRARIEPRKVLSVLTDTVKGAKAFKGKRGEAETMTGRLLKPGGIIERMLEPSSTLH